MRQLASLVLPFLLLSLPSSVFGAAEPKEWTLMVFMNGHNNLDRFGTMDMNEMEKVGTTEKVNVVVQWASSANGNTRRVLVRRDNDPNRVTSPAVETHAPIDMGDWRQLVEFVRWTVEHYPARRYFLDVWDHGSGWHMLRGARGIRPSDISWDDHTGNYITTEQLGEAVREAARLIGHPIDVYGSDACLMAMAEVADEMGDSVLVSVGSEEVEPAEGWPYDGLLAGWNALATATPHDVARVLAREYLKSYQNGSQGNRDVTFSAFDMTKMARFNEAVSAFGAKLRTLGAGDRRKVVSAASNTISFTYGDYGDLLDFLTLVERERISALNRDLFSGIRDAVGEFVFANVVTSDYARAKGVALWLPSSKSTYDSYATRYKGLRFHQHTGWGDALQHLLQD